MSYISYAHTLEKKRKPLFVLFILCMLFALTGILQLQVNPDMMIFMPDNSPSKDTMDDMEAVFGSADELIILYHTHSDTLNEETQKKLKAVYDTLQQSVDELLIMGPVGADGEIADFSFSDEISTLIQNENEWLGFFSLFTEDALSRSQIKDLKKSLDNMDADYRMTGTSFLQTRLVDYVIQILCYLPFLAIFLIFNVFRLQMRSLKATFMAVLPAVVGAAWALGLAGWSGRQVSIITAIAPIFTIVIGSADGLHFVSHYLEALSRGKDKKTAVAETLSMVGIPMIITTLTSMGGFLSLLVMKTSAIRDLAIFTSIGILLAGIATWFVLPLILINKVHFNKRLSKPFISSDMFKKTWGLPAYLISAGLIIAGLAGFSSVSTEFNQLSLFKHSTDVYESAEDISRVQGGNLPVSIFVESDKSLVDNDLRYEMEKLTDSLKQYGKTISPFSIINTIMESPQFRMMNYFSPQEESLDKILSAGGLATSFSINLEHKAAKITLLMSDPGYENLDAIKRITERSEHAGLSLRPTGMLYVMEDLNRQMMQNLRATLLLSLCIMFCLLLLTFRRLIPALISMIPISITMLVLYGFLGLTGISLSVVTATIFSITIGVGIDYAVHFTSIAIQFQDEEKAFRYASRPIMANALGLAVGMSALLFTPLTIHMDMSIMMWLTMVLSMFLSLSLLPTMLKPYFKSCRKKSSLNLEK